MLEQEAKIIGAPKGILGLYWYDIYLEGQANQAGPTPMEGRHDALSAAAEMILKLNQLPDRMGGNMVATVGEIQNYPNSRNIRGPYMSPWGTPILETSENLIC